MAGRKPVPTAIKLVKGNPGKRPLNPAEPEYAVHNEPPNPPSWLRDDQIAFWEQIAPLLINARVLTEADELALAALCVALGELKHANEMIAKGRVVKTPSGYVQQSPYVGIANSALKQARSLLSEFGMTPAARTRVMTTAGLSPEDAFQAFLGRGGKKKA